jgi:hypothetical protein
MKQYNLSIMKMEFVEDVWEVSPKSCDWDKCSEFDETLYFHLLNIGYEVKE